MATPPVGYLLGVGPRPMPLYRGDVLTLGREADNAIALDDLGASRRHSVLEIDAQGQALIRDLGSRNGTYVNEANIGTTTVNLSGGDVIRIGGKLINFVGNDPSLKPGQAVARSVRQVSSMETLDSGLYFKDGKVVQERPAAPPSNTTTATRPRPAAAPDSALNGNLADQSLPQVLQFLASSAMTGELSVAAPQRSGRAAFRQGHIFYAQAEELAGADALYEMARNREGVFSFRKLPTPPPYPDNVSESTMQLIFECCRRIDESGREAGEVKQ